VPSFTGDVGGLACGLVALLFAGASGKPMETTLQDDATFLHRPAAQVRAAARQVAQLGGDRIRLTAGWSAIAPHARARRMPGPPFDGANPATYPERAWTALDTAVKAADDAGLDVQLDVGFWAPRWAVRRGSPAHRFRRYPDPRRFGDIAAAVAKRYSGAFPDPAGGGTLPAVRMYTPWNEPNHVAFLTPQWTRDRDGTWRPESPHVYRAMYQRAWRSIKRVSRANLVLLGNTSSEGSTEPGRGGVPPLQFLRTLACVDDHLAPLRVPECRHFRPLRADGYAHHPYSRDTTPATSSPILDDVPLADSGRLEGLLAALALRGRISPALPLYDTEYGYESSDDDPFAPFDRAHQAAYLSWASSLAWRDPQTRMFAQFLLRDIDPSDSRRRPGTRSYDRDWQSGLYDAAGHPKPAARAFKLPFWAEVRDAPDGSGRVYVLWGQVRPNEGVETVRAEYRSEGSWHPLHTWGATCDDSEGAFLTDRQGVFERALPAGTQPADLRFAWRHRDGRWEPSGAIHVDPALPAAVASGPASGP
jgi:hypothetical protein